MVVRKIIWGGVMIIRKKARVLERESEREREREYGWGER